MCISYKFRLNLMTMAVMVVIYIYLDCLYSSITNIQTSLRNIANQRIIKYCNIGSQYLTFPPHVFTSNQMIL